MIGLLSQAGGQVRKFIPFTCFIFLFCGAVLADDVPLSDQEIGQKVDALLDKMSIDEKIGQMVLFTHSGTVTGPTGARNDLEDLIRKGSCGSIFNAHTVETIRHLQDLAVKDSRMKIPLLFGYDVIHGYKTIFPIPLAQAASWDTNAIEKAAQVAASEATAAALNWTFAPMVDIARDPRWGRIAEGAGEDPFLGCAAARAAVRGYQGAELGSPTNLLACVKHFAAYGGVQAGREYNSVDISERTLREVYLPPYKAAIDAGALSVMSAFNDLNGVPATANKFLLTTVLRDEWGFKGFVVTDYTSINELVAHGIAMNVYDAARLAVNAGVDMDMQGGAYLDYLKKLLAAGAINENQINDSVRRVLTVKYKLGLFGDPYRFCSPAREGSLIYTPANLQAAHDVACETMVLLQNTNDTLPLQPGHNIAVIGPLAADKFDLLGSWHGMGDESYETSIYDCIASNNAGAQTFYAPGCGVNSLDTSRFAGALETARKGDLVVLVLGETEGMTGEAASRSSIGLPGVQSALLDEVKKAGRPMVLVLVNGRPLALEHESTNVASILEAWDPGTASGAAVADVLFGKVNPSGRLPVTFPRNVGQVPIYYSVKNTGRPFDPAYPTAPYKSTYLDSPNSPLYPFGFGLSYTQFTYSQMQLDKTNVGPSDQITVTLNISNAGRRAGAEVPQLYVHHIATDVTRPLLELKGFQRIELQPGETRQVSFRVGREELTFLRQDMSWGTVPGPFEIMVGPSSRVLQTARCELVNSAP